MARVAIVTGGSRGIGEAISLKLQEQGVTVVANYGGNDEKARAFTERTGIAAMKWDVGDHQACLDSCARVAEEYRPDRHRRQQCRHHPRRHARPDEL